MSKKDLRELIEKIKFRRVETGNNNLMPLIFRTYFR